MPGIGRRHPLQNAGYDCGGQGEGQGYVQRNEAGWQNLPAGFNDQATSLRLPARASVRLYEHVDRAGASVCRGSDDGHSRATDLTAARLPSTTRFPPSNSLPGATARPSRGPQKWKARYDAGDACWWDSGCRPGLCLETLEGPGLAVDWADAPCGDLAGGDWVGEFRTALNFDEGETVFSWTTTAAPSCGWTGS